jgi:hypothetical protein
MTTHVKVDKAVNRAASRAEAETARIDSSARLTLDEAAGCRGGLFFAKVVHF